MAAQAAENLALQSPRSAAYMKPSGTRPAEMPQAAQDDAHAHTNATRNTAGPFVPLLILVLAFLAWSSFQTVQLWKESDNLRAGHASQNQLVENSQKVRNSLDAIAAGAARLAQQGNPNAKLLVEELAKRGVTINPNPQPK